MRLASVVLAILVMGWAATASAYPIDGYAATGIRRLEYLRLVLEGARPGPVIPRGSRASVQEIQLRLLGDGSGAEMVALPPPDSALQRRVDELFAARDPSYYLALLDITPGRPLRLASRHADRTFEPGSIGKLAVAAGLFAELRALFPDSLEQRRELLRNRMVAGGTWVLPDHHPVPIFDPTSHQLEQRPAREDDVFSLYEWADHMLSASANAAASVVWKEAMLMRAFGQAYPPTPEEEEAFFSRTARLELQRLAVAVVNDPLRTSGIARADWQLGTLFTQGGQRRVPGTGSWATPRGLLLFLLRLEQGRVVDAWSSLELKRLLYMTGRRIRYASSPAIAASRVYFKSGSLYRCQPEEGYVCGKYRGNATNAMNSVAIVETSDGRAYLVALASNVLRVNSAVDHQALAGEIEQLMK